MPMTYGQYIASNKRMFGVNQNTSSGLSRTLNIKVNKYMGTYNNGVNRIVK